MIPDVLHIQNVGCVSGPIAFRIRFRKLSRLSATFWARDSERALILGKSTGWKVGRELKGSRLSPLYTKRTSVIFSCPSESRPANQYVQKNIADIGMPGADRFHVDDDAIQQFGPPIQEAEFTKLVILLETEAVKTRGLFLCKAQPVFPFLNRLIPGVTIWFCSIKRKAERCKMSANR